MSLSFTGRVRAIAEEKDFGREMSHIHRVYTASTEIYNSMVEQKLLDGSQRDLELLTAVCYLHDVGVKVENGDLGTVINEEDDHNVRSFLWCAKRLDMEDCAGLMTAEEKAQVEYCLLWHKGSAWAKRPEVDISDDALPKARLLGGILRVGDSLASAFGKKKPEIPDPKVTVSCEDGTLYVNVKAANPGELVETDLDKATKRKDLMVAAVGGFTHQKISDIQLRLI